MDWCRRVIIRVELAESDQSRVGSVHFQAITDHRRSKETKTCQEGSFCLCGAVFVRSCMSVSMSLTSSSLQKQNDNTQSVSRKATRHRPGRDSQSVHSAVGYDSRPAKRCTARPLSASAKRPVTSASRGYRPRTATSRHGRGRHAAGRATNRPRTSGTGTQTLKTSFPVGVDSSLLVSLCDDDAPLELSSLSQASRGGPLGGPHSSSMGAAARAPQQAWPPRQPQQEHSHLPYSHAWHPPANRPTQVTIATRCLRRACCLFMCCFDRHARPISIAYRKRKKHYNASRCCTDLCPRSSEISPVFAV